MMDAIREYLGSKVVGIAGAGGLGSNCAVSLARTGVGKIIVADFDVVSRGNLNRQYYFEDQIGMPKAKALKMNIFRIDPHIRVKVNCVKVTPENIHELYDEVDVLIEAMDLDSEKRIFLESALELWPERPLIAGNGMAGWGNTDSLKITQYANLYICGDSVSAVSEDMPPLSPRVNIVANMQANIALDILMKDFDINMYNK